MSFFSYAIASFTIYKKSNNHGAFLLGDKTYFIQFHLGEWHKKTLMMSLILVNKTDCYFSRNSLISFNISANLASSLLLNLAAILFSFWFSVLWYYTCKIAKVWPDSVNFKYTSFLLSVWWYFFTNLFFTNRLTIFETVPWGK